MSQDEKAYKDLLSKKEQHLFESFLNNFEKQYPSAAIGRRPKKGPLPYGKVLRTGRAKKLPHELLSDEQKKANHIASEQKRRANIKVGFDQLVCAVPALNDSNRNEAHILQQSVEYIKLLMEDENKLTEKTRNLQILLGEMPDNDTTEEDVEC